MARFLPCLLCYMAQCHWLMLHRYIPATFPAKSACRNRGPLKPHQDIKSTVAHINDPLCIYTHAFFGSVQFAMEFSGKDLQDIQRVAGLLGLTVEELIQQKRQRSEPSPPSDSGIPGRIRTHRHGTGAGVDDPHGKRPDGNHHHDASPSAWQSAQLQLSPNHELMDVDPPDFNEVQASSFGVTSEEATSTNHHDALTEVILLNPQSVWYDCDEAFWDLADLNGETVMLDQGSGPSEDTGEGSFVPVTPTQSGSSGDSEGTAREEEEEKAVDGSGTGTDWQMVPLSVSSMSAKRTPETPTTGSTDARYHIIAPRPDRAGTPKNSASKSQSHRVRKKRSRYQGTKKTDTHLTRQVHACVRCRMQRNRCIPDPINPRGPCLTCQNKTARMSRLPCLRYMVTDSTLFRTGLDYMAFYKRHPMVGPHYGDFHIERRWTGAPPKILCLGQLGAMHFQVELQEFVPPVDHPDVDLKGRPMYAVPWAIADPDAVVKAMNDYIERGLTHYMYAYLDDTDGLVWDIFQAAYRASVFPTPNRMLQKALRLWVACRFIESKWRCWAETGWADSAIRTANPRDPYWDWDSLPPYLDYQIASIIIHRILGPLRKDVLRELQSTFNTHRPQDWYITFLTSFILLQNYEMQMQFQMQFAARRKAPGKKLFSEDFDWSSPKVRRMARLDPEQSGFMTECRNRVVKKAYLVIMGTETVLLQGAEQSWTSLRLKTSSAPHTPRVQEWPQEMKGDLCWESEHFASEQDYALVLSRDEISEIRDALQHFTSLGLYGSEVSPSNFPLPSLGPRLWRAAVDIHRGKGFAVIRGLRPADFSPEENVILFLGISSYIGSKRGRQDEDGNMLMHIRDAKLSKASQTDRPTRYSSRASTFHTDAFCDILALQTRTLAADGGRNILTSSWTVYNKLMAAHPHVRDLLAQPIWPFDSRGKFFECSTRPLLFYHGGRMILNFAREPLLGLEGVRRTAGLATLSPAQREALDLVEEIAKQSQIVQDALPGDLLFINNHGVLHSREGFTDAPGNSRYLVRMWLKNPLLAWKLPRALQEGNSRIYDDNELGERWNVVDTPKVQFRLSERLTS
ncbi:hypothetical protein QBC46DRAFT_366801 [Diplogelasinospora grovesii]|uniref:TauD/TfdA-like domain-containing protein n=1 Tax=Diplogelasinospora grovesii TaxID=303347 RepID=A0AAN6N1T1_9PEZI|nr:hypothetical protein QBC46DRAFT_366801 [Diplogelasinospora grovesii]